MKNKFLILTVLAAGATFLSFATIVGVANAQEADNQGSIFSKVAEILGVEQTELEDAFETVAIDEVNQKVEDGELDQEKADEIILRIEEDGFKLGRLRELKHPKAHVILEEVAEYLDVEKRELVSMLRDGMTPDEIITESGKSVEEARSLLITKAEEYISTKVDEGELTQEEADEKLGIVEEMVDAFLAGERPIRNEIKSSFRLN